MSWIVIPNWDRFQHYKDRDPTWIKDYVSQLHDTDWSGLTLAERGLLQTCRLMFAASDGRCTLEAVSGSLMSRQQRLNDHLASLTEAGLVDLRASRPLALTRSREKRSEEKNDSASAEPKNGRSMNGGLEPASTAVDQEMLRLAQGWISDHADR
jgi:hypothetical protein